MSRIVTPESGQLLPPAMFNASALEMLARRRSCVASALTTPPPSEEELQDILMLAARTPDHGKLSPWRFILLRQGPKKRLAEHLRQYLRTDTSQGTECSAKDSAAIEKLDTPPLSVTVISRTTECHIPIWEQQLSAGALCMNLITAVCAMGYGANWITGWYAYDKRVHTLLGLADNERIAGFVQIGSVNSTLKERPRCELGELVSEWQE